MDADISRIVAMVWPHVHDISVSVLAAAVAALGVVIMLELRSVLKLRQIVDGNLARIFEQLDLLRFESQQLIEGQQLVESHVQAGKASLAQSIPAQAQAQAQAAATPATTGEARLLSSLAQARARRESGGPPRA